MTTEVVVRKRLAAGNANWGSFTTMYGEYNNIPLPILQTGSAPLSFQNICGSPAITASPKITAQDLFTNQVHIFRNWDHFRLVESGQYPSLSLPYYTNPSALPNTYTFRGIDKDENGLYSASITSHSSGIEESIGHTLTQQFNAVPGTSMCEGGLLYAVAPSGKTPCFIANYDGSVCIPPYTWQFWEFLNHDSTLFRDSICNCDYLWPLTEDSVRTNNVLVSSGDSIQLDRVFHISDSTFLSNVYFGNNSRHLTYEVDLKDSATHAFVQVIDRISIIGTSSGPQILDMNNSPVQFYVDSTGLYSIKSRTPLLLTVPPSGKGYLTMKITKDSSTPLMMIPVQSFMDSSFAFQIPPNDSNSYKRASPTTTQVTSVSNIKLSVHPNPFRTTTDVEVDVPKDVPLNITVFDVLGHSSITLFNDLSGKDHFSYILDSKQLNPGMYFVRVQSGSQVVTQKIELVK